jgi:hypothetical protein
MIRSLCFVHLMLALAMVGVGDMVGTALDSNTPDQAWTDQVRLAALAFGSLTAASLTTAFILTKAGFHRFSGRH